MAVCTTCEADEYLKAKAAGRTPKTLPEATHIARPNGVEWPLCKRHAMVAVIAGWKPEKSV